MNKQVGIVAIALKEEWKNFKTSFSNPIVLKYSLWFIFGMTAYVGVSFKLFSAITPPKTFSN